jgi:hypothetical protein
LFPRWEFHRSGIQRHRLMPDQDGDNHISRECARQLPSPISSAPMLQSPEDR